MRWNVGPPATSDARIGRQECIQRRMIPPANHEPESVHRPGCVFHYFHAPSLFSPSLSLFTALYCSITRLPLLQTRFPPTLDPRFCFFYSLFSRSFSSVILSLSFNLYLATNTEYYYTRIRTSGYPEIPDWQTLYIILLCPIEKDPFSSPQLQPRFFSPSFLIRCFWS